MNSVKLHWFPERKFLSHGIAGITAWLLMVALSRAGVSVSIEEGGALILVVGLAFHYLMPPTLRDILNRIDGDLRRALGVEAAADQKPDVEAAARNVGGATLSSLALIALLMGGLAFAGPTACASRHVVTAEERTDAQTVFALQADYNSVLAAAVTYAESAEADPDVVAAIKRLDAVAYGALVDAQKAVRSGHDPTAPAAVAAAQAAIGELIRYVTSRIGRSA